MTAKKPAEAAKESRSLLGKRLNLSREEPEENIVSRVEEVPTAIDFIDLDEPKMVAKK